MTTPQTSPAEVADIEQAALSFETPAILTVEGQKEALKLIEWGIPHLVAYIRTLEKERDRNEDGSVAHAVDILWDECVKNNAKRWGEWDAEVDGKKCTVRIQLDDETSKYVWAVRCSNYEPMEVDSFWTTKEGAEKRCSELPNDGMWGVCCIEVQSLSSLTLNS